MKLLPLVLAGASAIDWGSYPEEIYMCKADQLNFGLLPTTSKFKKLDRGQYISVDDPHDNLVIFFNEQFQYWILNRSLGQSFSWYYLRSQNLFDNTKPWMMSKGGSVHVFGPDGHTTFPNDICEQAEKDGRDDFVCPLEASHMLVGKTPSCACAVGYDSDAADPDNAIVLREGEIKNMKKVDGERWTNKISFVDVQPGCTFTGWNRPNFSRLLGVWESGDVHAMEKKQNNKISSMECTCPSPDEPDQCAKQYFGGDGKGPKKGNNQQPCKTLKPQCDYASFEFVDIWRNNNKQGNNIGFIASVTVPAEAWDGDWAIALRWNYDNFSGRFEIPTEKTTNFAVVTKKNKGVEFVMHYNPHQKMDDLKDEHTFTIIGRDVPSTAAPSVFYWPERSNDRACYELDNHGQRATDFYSRAIAESDAVSKPEDVRRFTIKPNGSIVVKP